MYTYLLYEMHGLQFAFVHVHCMEEHHPSSALFSTALLFQGE